MITVKTTAKVTGIIAAKAATELSIKQKSISVFVAWWSDDSPDDESSIQESRNVIKVPFEATDDDINKAVKTWARQRASEGNCSAENQYWEWEELTNDDN